MKGERRLGLLGPGWGLSYDGNQWVISQIGKKGYWKPKWFVGGVKATLLRILREEGAVLSAEGEALLASLPERFLDFAAARGAAETVGGV